MKPQVHALFPTPLLESYIPVQEGWLEFIKTLDYDRTAMDNGYITSDRNIWEHDQLRPLYHEIKDAVKYFAYGQLKVSSHVYLDLLRGWAVKHMPDDWAQNHCHMNSIFSGIYYLDVHEKSGDVVMEKGQHYTNCFMPTLSPDVTMFNQFTMQSWRCHPDNGKILIFPSQLIHNVERNLSGKVRYCIGFDVFIRGTLGKYAGSLVTIK